jgi:carboxymethylenebutenolidase
MIPGGATRGIVVIHEIFGRAPEIDRVVERFARRGYAGVAPDLFFRGKLPCIRATFETMRSGASTWPIRQAERARSWLCAESGVPVAKVGIIGFCFGGSFALAVGKGWGAHSTNYGNPPAARVMEGIGPVIGCYGGLDRTMRGVPSLLRKRLGEVNVTPEVLEYPDAGHSLLTDGHRPFLAALTWPIMRVKYEPQIAEEAWGKIMAFFDRTLG